MQKIGSPAPSLHPPSFGGRNGGSSGSSRASPLPTERLVGFNPRGSCLGSGGLNPALSTISPSQPSSGKSHHSAFPFGVTPSPAGATSLASSVKDKSLPGCSRGAPTDTPPGTFNSQSPALVHFPEYASFASCHLQETDVSELDVKWKFCLIGYVAGKFPGYASMLTYISRTWQYKAYFTMHDSGWLIFAFSSETELLDVLRGGLYSVFGKPLILKVMPNFFDFQSTDMTTMPTWVRFPNLPLRCWNPICLSKIASMIGKPIHYDDPIAQMTRLSYARVLIEVDLLSDLSSSINVILPNGTSLSQQIMYESLPRLCKQCKIPGHSTLTCTKGLKPKSKKRSHETPACSASSSPSVETAAVKKQEPYYACPSVDPLVDPMFTEAVIAGELRPQSPGRKRSKVAASEHSGSTLLVTP